jgi:ABC-type bacteriocin/lantibiotic exporter with double-glycine peptidase domain
VRPKIVNILLVVAGVSALAIAGESSGVWLDVPFVKQEKNGCGAASIAMVMQFWQRQQGLAPTAVPDAPEIHLSLYSSKAHGIYASDLERYFEQHGYRAFAFEGRVQDLQDHLAKGRPLIVALQPAAKTPLHYVVVAGFDPAKNVVLVNDPAERKLLQRDLSTFKKEWKGAGNWTLLAVPQAERASSQR